MDPIPHTQHRPICVSAHPVMVPQTILFRQRFNFMKADWNGYSAELYKLIEDVEPIPANYKCVVESVRVASRRHIPRGVEQNTFPVLLTNQRVYMKHTSAKSPRRAHINPVLKSLHWLKIHDRITYKILMLTYKSYYNIAPTYLCELISRRESSVNTRLGADHHQIIMPPISKDCSNTFLERSFIYTAQIE